MEHIRIHDHMDRIWSPSYPLGILHIDRFSQRYLVTLAVHIPH